ncbi:2,3-diaminopropionate biosynthesis protein SbnB [Paenibacillus sp. GCM10027627]|uniref:2,3-diaminopropionate biosynthesis protein SbnB n=1 Tax=unclassified Paenibacillus TaxID=185978 RepID=UPI003625F34E
MTLLYLGEEHLRAIGFHWGELVDVAEEAAALIGKGDYVQPLKPYLRFRNEQNRIIAMPAYVGGDFHAAGLKWIASFPGNLNRGLPRAHSVTILNDADTGQPSAILNTATVSAARTAAVSGLMIRHWLAAHQAPKNELRIGIIGMGPIGRFHFDMCKVLYGDVISRISLYDLRGVELDEESDERWIGRIRIADNWEELYNNSDVIITCTVSDNRYIHLPPPEGALLLDVSLRDYRLEAIRSIKTIVVDSWTEVCRENTDIELLHRENGLQEEQAVTLAHVVLNKKLKGKAGQEPILFCPMGMAAFDIAVADWYVKKGNTLQIGIPLPR